MGYRLLDAVKVLGENPKDPVARQTLNFYLTGSKLRRTLKDNDFKIFIRSLPFKVKE